MTTVKIKNNNIATKMCVVNRKLKSKDHKNCLKATQLENKNKETRKK